MTTTLAPLRESTPHEIQEHGLAYAIWPSDLTTPVGVLARLRAAGLEPCLLESVDGPSALTAWSLVGVAPDARLEVDGDGGRLERCGHAPVQLAGPGHVVLRQARELVSTRARPEVDGLPPFLGGWIGCFTYEWARELEPCLAGQGPDQGPFAGLPHALFRHYRDLVAFDHRHQRLILITGAAEGAADALARRAMLVRALATALPLTSVATGAPLTLTPAADDERFLRGVAALQADIGRGEFFQAVLSRRLEAPAPEDPLVLYRSLRLTNPAPHMFFFETPELTLIGSSPERLAALSGVRAEAVPIAGTRPRGADAREDATLGAELLADTKERAEHDMLVDLARNDLGRVARTGTVEVTKYASLERFARVQHLVSRVEADLASGHDGLDLLAACFPAGTVSGAPKLRAMAAIAALEGEARGPYGGAFGYLADDGDLDMAIVIRTLVVRHGRVHVQAGAGIVWDSNAGLELQETEHKAHGLADALALAPALQTPTAS